MKVEWPRVGAIHVFVLAIVTVAPTANVWLGVKARHITLPQGRDFAEGIKKAAKPAYAI